MKLVGLIRLGRDAELRYSPSGDAVAVISGAWNYGKAEGGKRPTQWAEFTLWGNRAESAAPYLTTGKLIEVFASDPRIETFEKRDQTTGFKLVAKIDSFVFAGGREDGEQRQAAPAPAPRAPAPSRAPAAKPSTGFDDLDDSIPY